MRSTTRWFIIVAMAAVTLGAIVGFRWIHWKRFSIVEPGVLYRSGALTPWQLRRAINIYGIRSVFSFTHTDHEVESDVCSDAGVRRYFCYLPGDGIGSDDPYLRFLQLIQDPSNQPMLVHCSAGVQRTGGAVALFRTVIQDWPFDDAIEEMIAYGNQRKEAQIDQLRRICNDLAHAPASQLVNR